MVQRRRPGFSGPGAGFRHSYSLHRQALFRHGSESAAVVICRGSHRRPPPPPPPSSLSDMTSEPRRNVDTERQLADGFERMAIRESLLVCIRVPTVSISTYGGLLSRTNPSQPGCRDQ
ncbi:hypothetical protein LX36DRAFT_658775 [Colletotrichum falcatum]|nr:hypothetical protein LX36DRAFT_658775 [Colletotrichum falcatum]